MLLVSPGITFVYILLVEGTNVHAVLFTNLPYSVRVRVLIVFSVSIASVTPFIYNKYEYNLVMVPCPRYYYS